MTVQDSDRPATDAGRGPRGARDDAPDGLRRCLHAVAALALIVAVGQAFIPWVVSRGALLFAYVLAASTIAALFVVSVILRYIPMADAVGARARRDLARMMGAFALTADLQMQSALAWRPAKGGLLEGVLPFGGAGLLVVVGMVLIRHVAYGRARYIIPFLLALPLMIFAIVDTAFRLSAVSLATPLLLYAGCMLYARAIGLDVRPPTRVD